MGDSTHPRRIRANDAAKQIQAQQRRAKALQLRAGTYTYQRIADALGYSSAAEARKQCLKALEQIAQGPATRLRQHQYERYNALLAAVWPQALAGDLPAINAATKLIERLSVLMALEGSPRDTANAILYRNRTVSSGADLLGGSSVPDEVD